MNYKLRQTGQEVQDILDNAAVQHPIHTIESFVPTTKLANGVYCTEANTIVVVQDNGNKATTSDSVNGTRYYQWQDGELPDSGEYTMLVQGFQPFSPTANTITLTLTLAVGKNTSAMLQSATALIAGLMSAQDKNKLDGIENGAQVNSIERIKIGTGTPLNISDDGTIILPINGDMYGNPKGSSLTTYDAYQALQGLVNSISSNLNGLQDHIQSELSTIYNTIATKANIDYPTFTGIPTAPTAASGTNTTQIATTAFVQAAIAAGAMPAADKAKLDGIEAGAQVNNIKSVESIDDFFALDPYTLESGVWVCQGDYSLICVSELQGQGMTWMRFASFFDIDNCVVRTAMATGGSSSMKWSKTDGTYWRTVKNYENVIETIKLNGTTLQVSNKAVDIVLNTATSTDMVNLWNNL